MLRNDDDDDADRLSDMPIRSTISIERDRKNVEDDARRPFLSSFRNVAFLLGVAVTIILVSFLPLRDKKISAPSTSSSRHSPTTPHITKPPYVFGENERSYEFKMPEKSVEPDTYSCVAFDLGNDSIVITEATPKPSSLESVHHMSLYLCEHFYTSNQFAFRTRYTCKETIRCVGRQFLAFGFEHMSSARLEQSVPKTTVPYGAVLYVPRYVVVQVHNNIHIENDASSFEVKAHTRGDVSTLSPSKLAFGVMLNADVDGGIPPSIESFVVESREIAPLHDSSSFWVYGIHFHHHSLGLKSVLTLRRGRQIKYEAESGVEGDVVVQLFREDGRRVHLRNAMNSSRGAKNNNFRFLRDDVLEVHPNDEWTLSCVFNSTSRHEYTKFGFRASDEMCQCYLQCYTMSGLGSVRWSHSISLP